MSGKKYCTAALVYALLAMVGGVFYREFTKWTGYQGHTTLSVVHTHYFALGMGLFLMAALAERVTGFSKEKSAKAFWWVFQIGLNLTVFMFVIRGILQVLQVSLGTGMSAAISGIAGLGHAFLGVGILLFLFALRKAFVSNGE